MQVNPNIQEEYRALREEIRNSNTGILQLACYSLIAVAAILGYMMGSLSSYRGLGLAFLVPLSIICPSFFFAVSHSVSVIKIGTYIKMFIEPRLHGLQWETRVAEVEITVEELKAVTVPRFQFGIRHLGHFIVSFVYKLTGKLPGSGQVGTFVLPLFMVYLTLGFVCLGLAITYGGVLRPVIYVLGILALIFLVITFLAFVAIDWRKLYETQWSKHVPHL